MNFLEYLLFLLLEKIIPFLPLKFWHFWAKVTGKIFYYFIPVRKNVALLNLKLAFPEKKEFEICEIIKACYINIFTVIAEFFYMRRFSVAETAEFMKVTNPYLIEEKLKQGKGLILISAHFGNWELTAFGVSRIVAHPFNVIIKEQSNKKVNERINYIRTYCGNKLISMQNAPREVLTKLKENKIIAMLGDQAAPRENVKVNFFIKNVPAFEGTAKFAIKTGAALLFGVSVRNPDGTYSVTLHEIDTSAYDKADDESVRTLTQEHVNLLVKYIRQKPDHWLWFHRRFKNALSA